MPKTPLATATAEIDLDITAVHPSADNHRKTFNDTSLQELADSIREMGSYKPLPYELKMNRYFLLAIIKCVSIHQSSQPEMNSLNSRLPIFQSSLIWKSYIRIFLKYEKAPRKYLNGFLMMS